MTQLAEQNVTTPPSDTDLVAAIRRVLEASPEPLTLSKIRSSLPANFRSITLEALADTLQRQVAANLLVQYPKYRSQQDRFWDRPMRVHIAHLLQVALKEQPLGTSELRRKLPDYAKTQAESILEEEIAQGRIHRHPPANSRSGPRFGTEPADPRTFLRDELGTLFGRLQRLGFTEAQLRQAALELLHDDEWGPAQPATTETATEKPAAPNVGQPVATQTAPASGYSWNAENNPAPPTNQPATTPAAMEQQTMPMSAEAGNSQNQQR